MRYLLTAINAKYIHSNPAVYLLRESVPEEWKGKVRIAEFTINQYPDRILAGIYRERPDFLAISCYIWNMAHVRWLLDEIKKVLPQVKVWLGGPEAAYSSQELLARFSAVDGIMTGEGEVTFPALIREYEQAFSEGRDADLRDIPGAAVRLSGQGEAGPAVLHDLDKLPFIYKDLSLFENRIIYYESSRGCPFSCSYCLSAGEKGVRFRSLDLVEAELQHFLDGKVRQVKFLDRSFNCNEERTIRIWDYLRTHDNGVTNFHFELEPELLTDRELDLLLSLRPGQVKVEIGVQSTNRETLAAVRRKECSEHLEACAARLLHSGNVHVHLDLIAGLPFEDYESFRVSFNTVYGMHPHELQLGFLKILHGTPLEQEASQYGIRYLEEAPYEVLSTNWLSYEDILQLKRIEEVLEIYYNSGQFSRSMRVLETLFPDPFTMYEALADYYDRKGLFLQTSARTKRYDILLDFIREYFASKTIDSTLTDRFRELLTYDYYLRESAKRRPSFAPGRAPCKRNDRYHEEIFHFPVGMIRPYGGAALPAEFSFRRAEDSLLSEKDARTWRYAYFYDERDPVTRDAKVQQITE